MSEAASPLVGPPVPMSGLVGDPNKAMDVSGPRPKVPT